ncbi:MAG: alpha/beta fold hydrolase [Alphaproteobacteria bacterium]|nr:alpha/beta fold hydrolase [Alphaproteobacteria bacterium]
MPTPSLVLLLHGFGADADDLRPLVPQLARPGRRFLLPDAPVMRATIAGGWPVRAWYDILPVPWDGPAPREDAAGVRASAVSLRGLLADAQAAHGVPDDRVVLAGFSQGAAMALFMGLRHPARVAGIAALSSYLVAPDEPLGAHAAGTPVFMAHGTDDDVVPLARAEHARAALADHPLQWSTWPCGHTIHEGALDALSAWLDEVLPA